MLCLAVSKGIWWRPADRLWAKPVNQFSSLNTLTGWILPVTFFTCTSTFSSLQNLTLLPLHPFYYSLPITDIHHPCIWYIFLIFLKILFFTLQFAFFKIILNFTFSFVFNKYHYSTRIMTIDCAIYTIHWLLNYLQQAGGIPCGQKGNLLLLIEEVNMGGLPLLGQEWWKKGSPSSTHIHINVQTCT